MLHMNWNLACGAMLLLLVVGLGGCYENIEPAAATEQTPPAQSPSSTRGYGSGQPALGGAKRAAEGVVSDAQRGSQEIADGIDGN